MVTLPIFLKTHSAPPLSLTAKGDEQPTCEMLRFNLPRTTAPTAQSHSQTVIFGEATYSEWGLIMHTKISSYHRSMWPRWLIDLVWLGNMLYKTPKVVCLFTLCRCHRQPVGTYCMYQSFERGLIYLLTSSFGSNFTRRFTVNKTQDHWSSQWNSNHQQHNWFKLMLYSWSL